jgi:hypothetical protein
MDGQTATENIWVPPHHEQCPEMRNMFCSLWGSIPFHMFHDSPRNLPGVVNRWVGGTPPFVNRTVGHDIYAYPSRFMLQRLFLRTIWEVMIRWFLCSTRAVQRFLSRIP